MKLGVIADDFTGAGDIANTLVRSGVDVTLYVGLQSGSVAQCAAGVVALKTRSIGATDAIDQSLSVLRWLLGQGCRQIFFKYSSTFDSTPAGNIGPVAEALRQAMISGPVVFCPAFPAMGRTVYMGHLFVADRLLSESGIEHHPLNPMTDADLRRVLGRQVRAGVGHLPLSVLRKGSDATLARLKVEEAAERPLIIADAITEDDLFILGAALSQASLVTGASGLALGLARNFASEGTVCQDRIAAIPGPGVALAGSCSLTTLRQIEFFSCAHPSLRIDPQQLMRGTVTASAALSFALERRGETPLIYSSASPEAAGRFSDPRAALALEAFFGEVAVGLVEAGVRRLVVAGGETSGAVVEALGLKSLRLGPEIAPGVPVLVSVRPPLGLALKSGNFGGVNFFERAFSIIGEGHA